ncbi:superoxide dismutase [Myroides marinus]|uniref:superoxide dismutase n=1 Tax=Myroides marinus TaxID=703342 RepID=UPI0025756309|nr:superoxide dismutase [Myroides marinus]MDM1354223.1 superoxide dismutase [Myroides marinus]MDM1373331.1 superoxide dismutase [Myroides marinus]
MTKLKLPLIAIISLNFLILTSCGTKDELNEVQIPERESFATQNSNFPDPATIKTKQGPYEMAHLGYGFNDYAEILKPESVYLHLEKYHLSYANKLNTTVHGTPFERDSIPALVSRIDNNSPKIKNFAGGYYNHNLYWKSLSPLEQTKPTESLTIAINESFGSMAELKKEFISKGNSLVGAGWLWIVNNNGVIQVMVTANNDTPSMPEVNGGYPLIAIDLWEHAYYSTYEDDVTAYLEACFKFLNWGFASKRFIPKVQTTEVVNTATPSTPKVQRTVPTSSQQTPKTEE